MSKLSRAFKKVRKALKLPPVTLGTAAKIGAAAATGGLPALGAAVAVSKLKSAAAAGIKKAVKSKADRFLHKRTVILTPTISNGATKPAAVTMPGGAPIARGVKASKRRKAAASAKPKRARKASGGGRKPPKGGKDLKALSASWKAAGKPGRWIDWVKTH